MTAITSSRSSRDDKETTRKEPQKIEKERNLDMFSCCHDASEELECCSVFSSLFHADKKKTALLTTSSEKDEESNHSSPLKGKSPPSIETPTLSANRSRQQASIRTFTVEEQRKLSLILEYLSHRQEADADKEGPKDETSSSKVDGTTTEPASFLYQLASAAANVAFQAEEGKAGNGSTVPFEYGDDPEAAIQNLLQAGKQTEYLNQLKNKHLNRVKILEEEFPKLLFPLRHCWAELETCLKQNNNAHNQQQIVFMRISSVLLGRCDSRDTLKLLWSVIDKDKGEQSARRKIYNLIQLCFHLAVAQSFLTTWDDGRQKHLHRSIRQLLQTKSETGETKDCAIQSMVDSFCAFYKHSADSEDIDGDDAALQRQFLQWHDIHVPSLLSSLSLCLDAVFFVNLSDETNADNAIAWLLPSLDEDEGSVNVLFSSTSGPVSSWLYAVACFMPLHHHEKVGPTWHRLYSTNSQGFNLSSLEHSLTGYHGPTLIILEAFDSNTKSDVTFGAYASQPWKKQTTPEFYGDEDCFLFQLKPSFQVFRSQSESERVHVARNFQYFYCKPTKTPSSQSTKFSNGIGLGGSHRHPRFFIASTMDKCHFSSDDATFESKYTYNDEAPSFASNPFMDLHSIEAWGVGGDTALEALKKHRIMKEARLNKVRQVDKSAFLNDFRSGLIESKMFAFYEDIRNRDGGCLLDCQEDDEDGRWQIGDPEGDRARL